MSVFPTSPPPPGPPRSVTLPEPLERTLPNGLRVIAFAQRSGPKALGVPLVAAQLLVRCGAARESEAEAGLCALTSSLLTTGTQTRSALEIAQAVDALGARLDANSGFDASVVSVSATTPVFVQAFALLRDVVRTPVFAPYEVERIRTKSISDLGLTYSSPSSLARLVANRVAYGSSPYGHPLAGTEQTLAALTREKVAAFHATWYRPDNAVLVIGGDITTDAAFALADDVFGDWTAPATPLPDRTQPAAPAPAARVVAIDKPDAGRTAIVVGRLAIARNSPAYYAGTVATAVLSGYSGRLNTEIRVKRGLSYGAGAQLVTRREPGIFVAATLVDHARVAEATRVMLATLTGCATAPIGEAELAPRKETVVGGFARGIETIDGIVATLGELALFELPLGELAHFMPRILAVDADEIRAFAAATIADEPFVVLVGAAEKFAPAIAAQHARLDVIPFADLDLNRADLSVPAPGVARAARASDVA